MYSYAEAGPQQRCVCVCARAHVCGRENAGARHMEFINVLGKLPLPIKNHGFR